MTAWPGPKYRISVEFRAPLPYVFRWCTDYRQDDGPRGGQTFVRKVLARRGNTIVLQDLWTERRGWVLNHNRTTLFPPDRWHVDSYGTLRTASLDYRLTALPGGRTRLRIDVRRRPTTLHPEQPSRREYEATLSRLWSHFARSLDREYRGSARRSSR